VLKVEVEDPVGAGDAMAGYFSVAVAEGRPFVTALKRGIVAAPLAYRKAGAQSSIPLRAEVDQVIARTGW
jgi:ribokinase